MNDCSETKTLLMLAADGELAPDQIVGLERHVESCPVCYRERVLFGALDRDLGVYADLLCRENAAASVAAGGAAARGKGRAAMRWISQWAAAVAAMLVLGAMLVHRLSTGGSNEGMDAAFVPIPYVQALDPYETATVMRMDVPVAALISVGYKVDASDPTALVKADVLVGEDGRAHAVRVLSGLVLN
jgi:hypothetical protein